MQEPEESYNSNGKTSSDKRNLQVMSDAKPSEVPKLTSFRIEFRTKMEIPKVYFRCDREWRGYYGAVIS